VTKINASGQTEARQGMETHFWRGLSTVYSAVCAKIPKKGKFKKNGTLVTAGLREGGLKDEGEKGRCAKGYGTASRTSGSGLIRRGLDPWTRLGPINPKTRSGLLGVGSVFCEMGKASGTGRRC